MNEMRTYIRHPAEIPLQIEVKSRPTQGLHTSNVGYGGLAFISDHAIETGTRIRICIDVVEPKFEAEGMITYCQLEAGRYLVGVEFMHRDVEQICHIQHYKQVVAVHEGRHLTAEEAATEWISKYASTFPRWNMN
jgi:hypothetical protein